MNNTKILRKENKFAIFEYESNDNCCIDELLDFIDMNGQKIFEFFNIEIPKTKVHIKIVPIKKDFDELLVKEYGFSQAKWSRGFQSEKEANLIYFLSIGDYENTPRKFEKKFLEDVLLDYKRVLLHEFVHYVTSIYRKNVNCGQIERYITEGIACYLSGQFDSGHITYYEGKVYYEDIKFSAKTIDEIIKGSTSYQNYFILVKYILEECGEKTFFNLLESNRQAKEFLTSDLLNHLAQLYCGIDKNILNENAD